MEQPKPKSYHIYAMFFSGLFTTRRDQKLFLEYTKTQKQRAIPRLIATGLLLQLFTVFVPGEIDFVVAYALTLTAVIANLTLLALHYCVPSKRTFISHITWFVIWAQLLVSALRRLGDSFNELLGWAALLQYLTIATLPFSAPTLLLYTHLSMFAYIFVQYWSATMFDSELPRDLYNQVRKNKVFHIHLYHLLGDKHKIKRHVCLVSGSLQWKYFMLCESFRRNRLCYLRKSTSPLFCGD